MDEVRVTLACGCVKIHYENSLVDVELCLDHDQIYTLLLEPFNKDWRNNRVQPADERATSPYKIVGG